MPTEEFNALLDIVQRATVNGDLAAGRWLSDPSSLTLDMLPALYEVVVSQDLPLHFKTAAVRLIEASAKSGEALVPNPGAPVLLFQAATDMAVLSVLADSMVHLITRGLLSDDAALDALRETLLKAPAAAFVLAGDIVDSHFASDHLVNEAYVLVIPHAAGVIQAAGACPPRQAGLLGEAASIAARAVYRCLADMPRSQSLAIPGMLEAVFAAVAAAPSQPTAVAPALGAMVPHLFTRGIVPSTVDIMTDVCVRVAELAPPLAAAAAAAEFDDHAAVLTGLLAAAASETISISRFILRHSTESLPEADTRLAPVLEALLGAVLNICHRPDSAVAASSLWRLCAIVGWRTDDEFSRTRICALCREATRASLMPSARGLVMAHTRDAAGEDSPAASRAACVLSQTIRTCVRTIPGDGLVVLQQLCTQAYATPEQAEPLLQTAQSLVQGVLNVYIYYSDTMQADAELSRGLADVCSSAIAAAQDAHTKGQRTIAALWMELATAGIVLDIQPESTTAVLSCVMDYYRAMLSRALEGDQQDARLVFNLASIVDSRIRRLASLFSPYQSRHTEIALRATHIVSSSVDWMTALVPAAARTLDWAPVTSLAAMLAAFSVEAAIASGSVSRDISATSLSAAAGLIRAMENVAAEPAAAAAALLQVSRFDRLASVLTFMLPIPGLCAGVRSLAPVYVAAVTDVAGRDPRAQLMPYPLSEVAPHVVWSHADMVRQVLVDCVMGIGTIVGSCADATVALPLQPAVIFPLLLALIPDDFRTFVGIRNCADAVQLLVFTIDTLREIEVVCTQADVSTDEIKYMLAIRADAVEAVKSATRLLSLPALAPGEGQERELAATICASLFRDGVEVCPTVRTNSLARVSWLEPFLDDYLVNNRVRSDTGGMLAWMGLFDDIEEEGNADDRSGAGKLDGRR